MCWCGAGLAVVGMRCGGSTLGADVVAGGMTCAWDRSGVHRCGAGSDVVGMSCGGSILGADAGVCVAAAGCRRAEWAHCTWARRTVRDGAREDGKTSGTAREDRRLAAESKIVTSLRMVHIWSWPSVSKGAAGNRLARVSIKSRAARWVSLTENVWGMAQLWRKNSTVLAMCSAAAASM